MFFTIKDNLVFLLTFERGKIRAQDIRCQQVA